MELHRREAISNILDYPQSFPDVTCCHLVIVRVRALKEEVMIMEWNLMTRFVTVM